MTLPGDWRIAVIVRRIGAFSWATETTVSVAATPPEAPSPNPAPLFAPAGVIGMIVAALGIATLAVAAVTRTPHSPRRRGFAVAGAAALIAGFAILGAARIPLPSPASVVADTEPTEPAPSTGTPMTVMEHDHSTLPPAAATPVSLPAPGTPAVGDGLTVTFAAAPEEAGPVKVAVDLTGADGAPLADARVVLFSEMPAMGMGRTETPAVETQPGHYVAEFVPLGMSGEWRLTVRVSPRGQATQSFAFAVPVP